MIPEELRSLPQWVAWKVEQRRNAQGASVPTKVPYCSSTRKASSTDPSMWLTYHDALSILGTDGLGFVFAPDDPYCGIDMDAVVSATGRIHDAAYSIVRSLNGYTEFSPSGRGLHIIVRGSIPRGRHTLKTEWKQELAVYTSGRFFTVTGEGRGDVREAQAELNALIALYFPEPDEHPRSTPTSLRAPLCGDDASVLDRIHADPRIAALWAGSTADHGEDHSAADLALCAHLAFFCGGDASRVDALFRRSGLYRDKWNERRGDTTYGALTIDRALRGGT